MRRTPPYEPRLIRESRDGQQHEQRLKALEPQHAAGADHGHSAKSCQDLRKHSSTWHQQRRDDRDNAGGLRPGRSHCGGRGAATAGHGAFTAERQTFRSNVV
jgi:hypothetical protein